MNPTLESRARACLLGGAIGDALGYPVEFLSRREMTTEFGPDGITAPMIDTRLGKAVVSDDTQMTLFLADGLLMAEHHIQERGLGSYTEDGVYPALLRWFYTQTRRMPTEESGNYLGEMPHEVGYTRLLTLTGLYERRAPGHTCLTALGSGEMGSTVHRINNSKGCGGIMRAAPVGILLWQSPESAFLWGCETAAITHTHPTGYLTAGVLAVMVACLLQGNAVAQAVNTALDLLERDRDCAETRDAMLHAIQLAGRKDLPPHNAIPVLGEGWIAEETLAIALYCLLRAESFPEAAVLAVNHDGDSDSTGAVLGNLWGAAHGMDALPVPWADSVEFGDLLGCYAHRLLATDHA